MGAQVVFHFTEARSSDLQSIVAMSIRRIVLALALSFHAAEAQNPTPAPTPTPTPTPSPAGTVVSNLLFGADKGDQNSSGETSVIHDWANN